MSWNSRSKLNFSQWRKQIDTHRHKIRVHSQKYLLKPYPEGNTVEWWMMHLFSCKSPSLEVIFVTHPLTLVVAISPGKVQPPQYWRFLAFYSKCFLSTWSIWLVRKPGRCSTFLIPGGVSHATPHFESGRCSTSLFPGSVSHATPRVLNPVSKEYFVTKWHFLPWPMHRIAWLPQHFL
jgi:hypothetical protein